MKDEINTLYQLIELYKGKDMSKNENLQYTIRVQIYKRLSRLQNRIIRELGYYE